MCFIGLLNASGLALHIFMRLASFYFIFIGADPLHPSTPLPTFSFSSLCAFPIPGEEKILADEPNALVSEVRSVRATTSPPPHPASIFSQGIHLPISGAPKANVSKKIYKEGEEKDIEEEEEEEEEEESCIKHKCKRDTSEEWCVPNSPIKSRRTSLGGREGFDIRRTVKQANSVLHREADSVAERDGFYMLDFPMEW